MAGFAVFDYLVLVGTLVISAAIGIYYRFSGGNQRTNEEYLLGNQKQKIIPVAFSLMASFMSAVTLLGVSEENYSHGFIFVLVNLGYLIGVPFVTRIFLPVFFNFGAISVYEYLEKRFGFVTRLTCSFAFLVQMMLYSGIVLYAPATALEAISGLSQSTSIIVVGFCCLFYSTIGGIKAVIVTDVFQSTLMYGALISIIIVAAKDHGGLTGIWQIAQENGRINLYNPSLDLTERHSWLALLFGGFLTFLSLYGINQTQVQRYLTMKNYDTAVKSLWISLLFLIFLSLSTCFCGLAFYAHYQNCDPLSSKRIKNGAQLMPLFVSDTMGQFPGLSGLFISGLFSASLSSVSAAVNSLAAVTLQDFIKPAFSLTGKREMVATSNVFLTKALVFMFAGICICLAYIAQYLGSILQTSLTIFGVLGGPLLGVFTLGVLVPSCNEKGALFGLASGLLFSSWLGFNSQKPKVKSLPVDISGCVNNTSSFFGTMSEEKSTSLHSRENLETDVNVYNYLFKISYLYYIVLGFLVTMLLGILISYFTEPNEKLSTSLYAPCMAKTVRKCQRKRLKTLILSGKTNSQSLRLEKIKTKTTEQSAAC